jgi:hypothetical protein
VENQGNFGDDNGWYNCSSRDNDAAVVFDTHEPIEEGQEMNAGGALRLESGLSLNVLDMDVKDVIMATSAAPYFFPADEIDTQNRKISFFFPLWRCDGKGSGSYKCALCLSALHPFDKHRPTYSSRSFNFCGLVVELRNHTKAIPLKLHHGRVQPFLRSFLESL